MTAMAFAPQRSVSSNFYYRSIDDLNRLIVEAASQLPHDLDLIVGVPRSGLLPANLLALYLHLPLTDVEGLLNGRLLSGGHRLKPNVGWSSPRRVLVVDDSVATGRQLQSIRDRLANTPHEISYAAAYVAPLAAHLVDYAFEILPEPRVFEWNVMHSWAVQHGCMDIDGVLCRDPTAEENDDGDRYRRFLAEVPLRYFPAIGVKHLVTNRLERYRADTEAWLHRHGVKFERLWMSPFKSARERREANAYASFKAEIYTKTGAPLFIESSKRQSEEIASLSRRPVFCTDTRQMIYPDAAAGARLVLWGADPGLRIATQWYLARLTGAFKRRLTPSRKGA